MEQTVVEGGILTGEKIKIKAKDSEDSGNTTSSGKRRHSASKRLIRPFFARILIFWVLCLDVSFVI